MNFYKQYINIQDNKLMKYYLNYMKKKVITLEYIAESKYNKSCTFFIHFFKKCLILFIYI